MVCKRSLYCWKNGPCANEQTRKQIWEDNIRFRENLRDINQSDHYWSFQISENGCLCLEGEDVLRERPFSRRHRSASLHEIDCTSITHACNSLKSNGNVNCPMHKANKSFETEQTINAPQTKKNNNLTCVKYPFQYLPKSDEDKSEYCQRYKNTLLNSCLKPKMKTKFLSQTNLSFLKNYPGKKPLYTSCENIQSQESKPKKKKETTKQQTNGEKHPLIKTTDCQVQTDPVKPTKMMLKPVKFPHKEDILGYSPISRTTRKMLESKKVPFATYACNNSNLDIGAKRTHNVLASKLEVYPNAICAKQQKRDLIMKYIQSEKEFQKKCLPEELQRKINHSSLWSLDSNKKETKSQRKNTKYLLPAMNKPPKKINVSSSQADSAHYRTHLKPQIHFY